MQKCAIRFHVSRFSFLLLAAFLPALLSSCQDDEVCEEATANELRIGFYPTGQEEEFWATIDSLMVYTLEQPGIPVHDTLFSVSILELPLNTNAGSSTFIIDFFASRDTLSLQYERETHLVSVECGFTMFFTLEHVEYTTHYIDGLVIEEPYVTNSLDEHIKIFVPDTIPADK